MLNESLNEILLYESISLVVVWAESIKTFKNWDVARSIKMFMDWMMLFIPYRFKMFMDSLTDVKLTTIVAKMRRYEKIVKRWLKVCLNG